MSSLHGKVAVVLGASAQGGTGSIVILSLLSATHPQDFANAVLWLAGPAFVSDLNIPVWRRQPAEALSVHELIPRRSGRKVARFRSLGPTR